MRFLLRERSVDQNAKCNPSPANAAAKQACAERQQRFNADSAEFVFLVNEFNDQVRGHAAIAGMNAYAVELNWALDERHRLDTALHALSLDNANRPAAVAVQKVWTAILARGSEFAADALRGRGPGMPGAGQQSSEDCAVFALANATGVPYGGIAARVTAMMREGTWRSATDRADPQRAIETRGLLGGEVVLMTEALGQVDIVERPLFAATITSGRPVMVNVIADGGGAHQVVLARTFARGGETWFEMMDSNQGPIRRLYVSYNELGTLLQENGIVYTPGQIK